MSYIQGFVVPVPEGNKQAYLDMATGVAPMFAEFGALRTVECWGERRSRRQAHRLATARSTPSRAKKIVFAWVCVARQGDV